LAAIDASQKQAEHEAEGGDHHEPPPRRYLLLLTSDLKLKYRLNMHRLSIIVASDSVFRPSSTKMPYNVCVRMEC
jgi:hypothetical protein